MIIVMAMLSVYCQRWLPEALLISPIACVLRCSVSYNLRPCGDRRRRANAVSCVTIHVAAPVDCTVGITVPHNSLHASVCPIVLTLQDTCADGHALPCLALLSLYSHSRCLLLPARLMHARVVLPHVELCLPPSSPGQASQMFHAILEGKLTENGGRL